MAIAGCRGRTKRKVTADPASSGGSCWSRRACWPWWPGRSGRPISTWPGAPCRREFRRRAAFLYLDALLIGYAIALVVAIGLIVGVLAIRRLRPGDEPGPSASAGPAAGAGRLDPPGLLALDVGAAAWSAWQDGRPPALPEIRFRPADGEPPRRSCRRPRCRAACPSRPGDGGGRPAALRLLVIGESSGPRASRIIPGCPSGQIVGLEARVGLPGPAGPGRHLGRRRRHPRRDARPAGRVDLSPRRPDRLRRPQRVPGAVPLAARAGRLLRRRHALAVFPRDAHGRAAVLAPLPPGAGDLGSESHRPAAARSIRPASWSTSRSARRRNVGRSSPTSADGSRRSPRIATGSARCRSSSSRRATTAATTPADRCSRPRRLAPSASRSPGRSPAPGGSEEQDPAEALRLDRELVARHPEFAETHYRLARLLEQAGDADEAAPALRPGPRRRRPAPALPGAAPPRLPRGGRQVPVRPAGRRPQGARDGGQRHGIVDDRLFHDAQHPNLRGYGALAQDLLEQLRDRRAFGWPEGAETSPVVAEDCTRHFGIDAGRWAEICRRESKFYEVTAYIRYDPAFRLERCEDYRRRRGDPRRTRSPRGRYPRPGQPGDAFVLAACPTGGARGPLIAGRHSTYFPRPSPVVVEVCRSA